MPKATKRKKEKEADFKKAKLKLGKGKKVPTNATNTSFKARSIALPGQTTLNRAAAQQDPSARPDLLSVPLTNAGLTLDEVFIRLRHPNAGVRRDALGGVKEIVKLRPEVEVGRVMRALGGMISDEEPTVRKGLLGLLDWYFAMTPEASLAPHLPLFLLQTSSALSHIFADIRLDAARLVTLLLENVPKHVTAGWPALSNSGAPSSTTSPGVSILEGLRLALGLGGAGTASSAQARLTAGGKLVYLRAVLSFVRRAIGDEGGEEEGGRDMWAGWLDESSGGSRSKALVQVGEQGLILDGADERSLLGMSTLALDTVGSTTWEVGRMEAGSSTQNQTDIGIHPISALFIQLQPLLLSTFLESAPSAFSPSSNLPSSASTETHIDLCVVCAALTALLGSAVIAPSLGSDSGKDVSTAQVRSGVSDFLKRMSTYFPFSISTSLSTSSSSTGLSAGFELNLSYARLAALLAPQPVPMVIERIGRETAWKSRVKAVEQAWQIMRDQADNRKEKGKGKAIEGWAMDEVSTWIADVLSPSKDISAPSLTPSTFAALLPIIWSILTQPPSSESSQHSVRSALFSFISRQTASSAIRQIGDEFIMRLIKVHEDRYPKLPFFVPLTSPFRAEVRAWVEGIPKTLWELGNKNERASEGLIRFLLEIGMKGEKGAEAPYSLLDVQSYPGISAKLTPFFHLSHAARGSTPGPWARLISPQIKKLALDMGQVWLEWDRDGRLGAAMEIAMA